MQNFLKIAKEKLTSALKQRNHPIDTDLLDTTCFYFEQTAKNTLPNTFEVREKQLLFSYLLAYEAQKPIALSLGCGEGKQEGFGVALRSSYKLLAQKQGKTPTLLFLSLNDDLLSQMKNSATFHGAKEICVIDEHSELAYLKKPAIYMMTFKSFLYYSLQMKMGKRYPLFENIDKIFVDEFHAFINAAPYVMSKSELSYMVQTNKKLAIQKRMSAYKKLLNIVDALHQENPALIAQSSVRERASFNPYGVTKEGKTFEHWLYDSLKEENTELLSLSKANSFEAFYSLLQDIANALAKEPAKDYYIYKEKDNLVSYECADKNGKPMEGTRFSHKLFSLLIALKHAENFSKKGYEREFEFLCQLYLQEQIEQITPAESIKRLGAKRFCVASATLQGVSKQLEELEFTRHTLQEELQLTLSDKQVRLNVQDKSPIETLLDSLKTQNFPNAVLLTSKNANLLKEIAKREEIQSIFSEYERELIYLQSANPNPAEYEQKLQEIKSQIYKNPNKKRLLLIQGIAEGTNIFQSTPNGCYEALLYKLDISPIDRVTQTRYRVGVKGRVEGAFVQSVSTSLRSASILTIEERDRLQKSKTPDATLLQIQKDILTQTQESEIVYHKRANRRDFLTNALKLSAASLLANPLSDILNTLFGERLFYKGALEAKDYSKFPPGIINCRDERIKQAYYWLVHSRESISYGGTTGFTIAKGILRIGDKTYSGYGRVKEITPMIEPAYWFLCAKGNFINGDLYLEVEKKNPAMTEFARGISKFYGSWVDNRYRNIYGIEEHLLNAIFLTAGKTKQDTKNYQRLKIEEKKEVLEGIMEIYKSYPLDKNSTDPMNGYNRLLLASWASFWLDFHYEYNKQNNNLDIMFDFIEKELFMYSKDKIKKTKPTDLRIRGPPYFY